jgi:hypothetical protein
VKVAIVMVEVVNPTNDLIGTSAVRRPLTSDPARCPSTLIGGTRCMRGSRCLVIAFASLLVVGALPGCTDPDPIQLPSLTPTQLARSAAIPTGLAYWEQVDENARTGSENSQSVVSRTYLLRGRGDPVEAFVQFASGASAEGVVWQDLFCYSTRMSLNGTELIGGATAYSSADLYPDDRRLEVHVRSSDRASSGGVPDPEWSAYGCSAEAEGHVRTAIA